MHSTKICNNMSIKYESIIVKFFSKKSLDGRENSHLGLSIIDRQQIEFRVFGAIAGQARGSRQALPGLRKNCEPENWLSRQAGAS
jgi:hypothetical protein